MEVDYQSLFNIMVGLCGALGGWFMNVMWSANKEVRDDVNKHKDTQREHERDVAQTYMRKDDFHSYMTPIRDQLNRIEDKIDRKEDKRD